MPARRKVIEYTGEKVSRRETKRRGDGKVTSLFTRDDYWTLDGAFAGTGVRFWTGHPINPHLRGEPTLSRG
jgi:hypothetical protein